jgi:hypothetical protein
MGRQSTGIETLEWRLSGGLEPGSVLAILASPETQSEALLHQLLHERPRCYVTALRRPAAIEAAVPAGVEVSRASTSSPSASRRRWTPSSAGR